MEEKAECIATPVKGVEKGPWFLDLIDMEFTVISKKAYDLHGVERKEKVPYEWYLDNLVFLEDRAFIEQTRLILGSGIREEDSRYLIHYRCINQESGKVQWLRDYVEQVIDKDKIIGLRGSTEVIEWGSAVPDVAFSDEQSKNNHCQPSNS